MFELINGDAKSSKEPQRVPSQGEYTDLLKGNTPEPPCTPAPTNSEPRRPSLLTQQRIAADARTHPSCNFHLPRLAIRNAAHAEELLAIFCVRVGDWVLATFHHTSPEARLLHELKALNILLQSSAQARTVDPTPYETEAHASDVLELTREAIHAKDRVTGFRLSFQVDKNIYDIVEVTQVIHSVAVSTLMGLFLST
jgi:hypothetical protein